MNTQEALRMAISYIEGDKAWLHLKNDVLNACKEALSQEQKPTVKDYLTTENPVAWIQTLENQNGERKITFNHYPIGVNDIPLYTHPAQPLSDDKILNLAEYHGIDSLYESGRLDFARAIEKAHGIL